MDLAISFDVSGSSADAGFTLASADLDFGDGSTVFHFAGDPATWQVTHAYPKAGADVATLTVTDSDRLSATTTVPVTVFAAPTASIAPNRPPQVGIPTTFQATASTPPGTAFTDYQISFDGGATFQSVEESQLPIADPHVREGRDAHGRLQGVERRGRYRRSRASRSPSRVLLSDSRSAGLAEHPPVGWAGPHDRPTPV